MTAGMLFPDDPLEAAFRRFHAANPRVYELIDRFAREAIDRGRRHYAIATIYERVRWHVQIETTGDEFKLNNNHRAFYARLWMAEHPEFPGFFDTRARAPERDEG